MQKPNVTLQKKITAKGMSPFFINYLHSCYLVLSLQSENTSDLGLPDH